MRKTYFYQHKLIIFEELVQDYCWNQNFWNSGCQEVNIFENNYCTSLLRNMRFPHHCNKLLQHHKSVTALGSSASYLQVWCEMGTAGSEVQLFKHVGKHLNFIHCSTVTSTKCTYRLRQCCLQRGNGCIVAPELQNIERELLELT